jgi:surface protein
MKKKFLLLLLCTLTGALSAMALEAYVEKTNETTLTFRYGTRPQTGTTYSLNEAGGYSPGWYNDGTYQNVTKVVFDPSFDEVRPQTTLMWFEGMANLTSITGWQYLHTDEVFQMGEMFQGCTSLTELDLSHFNTSNLHYMDYMFTHCTNLSTIYVSTGWTTANVSNSKLMFYGCTNLVGGQGTTYDANHVDATYAHIDDGTSNPGYLTDINAPKPYVQYHALLHTLTFYCAASPAQGQNIRNYTLDSGTPGWYTDGTYQNVTRVVFDPSFDQALPTSTMMWFCEMSNLTEITGWQYLHTDSVTNMASMFYGCSSLSSLNVSNFNTSKVLTMQNMFAGCSSLNSLNVSNFNTSKVTNMTYMFYGCTNLNSLNISNFNTSNVTAMQGTFAYCRNLPVLNFGMNFNTSNVTDMQYMFEHCTSLTELDLSNFNTNKVVSFASMLDSCANLKNITLGQYFKADNAVQFFRMFADCSSLTSLNLSYFNPVKAKNMGSMFQGCSSLTDIDMSNFDNTEDLERIDHMFQGCSSLKTLDLSSIYTGNVTDMYCTFYGCNSLETIYAGNQWSTANVTSSALMFNGCTSLVGGQGTTFDPNHIDDAYAHIDGGPSDPGYFTDINAPRPYVQYHELLHTLIFYCALSPAQGHNIRNYTLNTGYNDPGWVTDHINQNVTKVVFDPSFENAYPTSTYCWFINMANLSEITGLEYLNTDSVTIMRHMFQGTNLTTLDLSHFNTGKLVNTYSMFNSSANLKTIYVGDGWTTDNVINSSYMFYGCTNLVGGMGTTYDENHINKAYAHIDGGTSNPGYFTEKPTGKPGDANGDGKVDVNDVTTTINYILSKNPSPFIFENANVNGDANINVMDVTLIINIILGIN